MLKEHENVYNQPVMERNVDVGELKRNLFASRQLFDKIKTASHRICHQLALRQKRWNEGELIK